MGFTLYVVLYGLLALPDNGHGRDVYLVDAFDSETAAACGNHFPFIAGIAQPCTSSGCIDVNLCKGTKPDPCGQLTFIQAPLQDGAKIRLSAKVGNDLIGLNTGRNEDGDLSKIWPLGRHLNVAKVDQGKVAAHLRLGSGQLEACSLSFIEWQADQYKVGSFGKMYLTSSTVLFHQSELIESALWSRTIENGEHLQVSIDETTFKLKPIPCFDDPDERCIYLYFANPSNRFPHNHTCIKSLEYDAAHFGHYLKLFDRPATTTPRVVSDRWVDNVFYCDALKNVLIPAVPDIDKRCLYEDLSRDCNQPFLNATDRAACPIVQ